MKHLLANFLTNLPDASEGEVTETVFENDKVRIERIVSQGQKSPKGFYYDQSEDEWVYLMKGSAKLAMSNPKRIVSLSAGDSYFIPAHQKHRIEKTASNVKTVWFAVFFKR